MMNILNKLLSAGSTTQAVPTDMSQIKVPQQPVDLSSVQTAAGSQVSMPTQSSNPLMQGLMNAMVVGGVNALGNMHGKPQQATQATMYRGGGGYSGDQPSADQFSNARMSNLQKFAKMGLMSQQ